MNADEAAMPSVQDGSLRRRIEELETELEGYRKKEWLVIDTLMSATRHATAIRESARRDAELALRKARIEAAERKRIAELERDHATAELLRLRRITERMRNGLATFLTASVDELRLEDEEQVSEQNTKLEEALASVLDSHRRTEIQRGVERDPIGGSPHDLS